MYFPTYIKADPYRWAFFASMLLPASIQGILSAGPIPLLHAELLLLLPWLGTRPGACAATIVILVAWARAIQAALGFDQIFVSVYLLWGNITYFPLPYALILGGVAVLLISGTYAVFRRLPARVITLDLKKLAILALLLVVPMKALEEYTRINLVGSSTGYVVGQIRFSNMLTGDYLTPGARRPSYAGTAGADEAFARRKNYWLIVVESMGRINDPDMEQLLLAPFHGAAIQARYALQRMDQESTGSTIHGELRNLCNGRLVDGLFGEKNGHCLPHRFSTAGYRTTAVHANGSKVYGRNRWYSGIGFQDMVSTETEGFPKSVRPGAWGTLEDPRMLDWVSANRLRTRGKQFTYTLTVSSHLPALPIPGSGVLRGCLARYSGQSCVHAANLALVLEKIAEIAAEIPDTVICIIGDHPPPFLAVTEDALYDSRRVTGLLLLPRP